MKLNMFCMDMFLQNEGSEEESSFTQVNMLFIKKSVTENVIQWTKKTKHSSELIHVTTEYCKITSK